MTDGIPLLYYRTKKQMSEYRKLSVLHKVQQLEMQMEFMHLAMPEKAKAIRRRMLQTD